MNHDDHAHDLPGAISRRRFLRLLGLSGVALFAAGCRPGASTPAPTPLASLQPTATPAPATATAIPPTLTPTPAPSATATATATPAYKSLVAVGRASAYEPRALRQELERMLSSLGGLSDLALRGARVGIKPNSDRRRLVGCARQIAGHRAVPRHPAVGRAVRMPAGPGRRAPGRHGRTGRRSHLRPVGYREMAGPLGIEPVDLCQPAPYAEFSRFPVGPRAAIYDEFELNGVLGELDVFVSVAKLKCHSTTGVTLALKNLIGIAPISRYRRSAQDNNRSAFHESVVYDTRVPRVVLDLSQARPIHLALIDGVITGEGGAGPWDAGLAQVRPGVLLAGRDAVATDAVAAAVMGFDPAAPSGSMPFVHADNHLALAHELGLGTNVLDEIGIAGPAIRDVLYRSNRRVDRPLTTMPRRQPPPPPRPAPISHLALPDGARTLCDRAITPEQPSTVIDLHVPIQRIRSLSDARPECRAAVRRLQQRTPALKLRVVIARGRQP
jgi:uncharacterized protein (DUF362 family)